MISLGLTATEIKKRMNDYDAMRNVGPCLDNHIIAAQAATNVWPYTATTDGTGGLGFGLGGSPIITKASDALMAFIVKDEVRIKEKCIPAQNIHQISWTHNIQTVHVHDVASFKEQYKVVSEDIKSECELLASQKAFIIDVKIRPRSIPMSPYMTYETIEITVSIQYWKPED